MFKILSQSIGSFKELIFIFLSASLLSDNSVSNLFKSFLKSFFNVSNSPFNKNNFKIINKSNTVPLNSILV